MLSREWFTAAALAALALPGLPRAKKNVTALAKRAGWQHPEAEGRLWRRRRGGGGGIEYHCSVLPAKAQAALARIFAAGAAGAAGGAAREALVAGELWAWFERQPETKKATARARLEALEAVAALVRSGVGRRAAVRQVAALRGVAPTTLYNWQRLVAGVPRQDWLPRLAPQYGTAGRGAACSPEAWEFLKADYLRPEQPNFADCYRRLAATAAEAGWTVPSARTLLRRLAALPEGLRVLTRQGAAALQRLYPAQARERGVFHALEAVNADGHVWDVFVRWPDGEVARPVMVAFQDIYSGMILSWRVDRTENKEAVRLAFGDLVERYGVPDHCWLDNGRNFASKWLTGGVPNRYRFKVRDDEPHGLMTALGVQVHWTTPYSGQSKPIERAFRDFAQGLAKHPAFAGAWTGNDPRAKPANYASRAVPLDTFLEVVAAGIAEHNARPGRKSEVCRGRSFAEAFAESYARAPIRRASAEQRRLWLMAAEGVMVRRADASIHLEGNRYWADFLLAHRGRRAVVRFDPQALQEEVHVYRLDGTYLGAAPCVEAAGFADVAAAREHARRRRAWLKGYRQMAAAERTLSVEQVAALLPKAPAEPPAPPPKVVRLVQGGAALRPAAAEEEDDTPLDERLFVAAVRALRAGRSGPQLRVVAEEEAGAED
ncbi:transposase [Caldovatus sediminis]|uniref:Transposase n=1 Tax=Caldovatus sediminis TaxID=2041189 RepID=A0A8J3EDI0_9PROT|nr:transposase domain-containing protein [Caldovatus sediminis]GGG30785.1 transposase [Caldovatus sediminis]